MFSRLVDMGALYRARRVCAQLTSRLHGVILDFPPRGKPYRHTEGAVSHWIEESGEASDDGQCQESVGFPRVEKQMGGAPLRHK